MQRKLSKQSCVKRRGVSLIPIVVMLTVLAITAAGTVNIGYIQLLRTQQKVATDMASKAAAATLVRTESEADAISLAQTVALAHQVGTQQFQVPASQIEFGHSSELENGTFQFVVGATPLNSARVISQLGSGDPGETSAVDLFFKGLGYGEFRRTVSSVSTFIINDVVLCLDRSGSMKFDMSGQAWTYPTGNPHIPAPYNSYYVDSTSDPGFWEYYYAKPHPTNSRWANLEGAIELFMDEAAQTADPPIMGLVTWSSHHAEDGTATVDYPLPSHDIDWLDNRDAITQALLSRAADDQTDGVFGGTHMADGMRAGLAEFESDNARGLANRVMILLTDGVYQGEDPYNVAIEARDAGVTIHCVALLSGATFSKAVDIATVTGGDAYMATNEAELQDAFIQIARSLNLVLTK